jgi:hypothetical protein
MHWVSALGFWLVTGGARFRIWEMLVVNISRFTVMIWIDWNEKQFFPNMT